MFGLGMSEILIILAAALIFIGPKKLPELARGLGKGLKEFQNAAKGITSVITDPVDEFKNEIKKDMPSMSSIKDELLDDPTREHGEDFVSADDMANLPDDYSPEHDESGEPVSKSDESVVENQTKDSKEDKHS